MWPSSSKPKKLAGEQTIVEETNIPMIHTNGTRLWVASGQGYLKMAAPFTYNFGFFEKRVLWKTIQEWKRQDTAKRVKNRNLNL